MSQKTVITCALTGLLTDPAVHNVPVTPKEMADHAEQAFNEGASIVHCHFRNQEKRLGHLPTWDLDTGCLSGKIQAGDGGLQCRIT
jgi:3-keto-5-aminohexanoate cleavage enzyme